MSKTIISYNINGIRAGLKKGLAEWLKETDPDILCIQETKAQPEQVTEKEIFTQLGYEQFWHSAEKKGYSGVAIFSKMTPDKVTEGCGMEQYDQEGRILRADFGDWTLLNCYFPSGTTGEVRQDFKMGFLRDFQQWIDQLRQERPQLIVLGDYNIAHTEMDIHDPVRNKKTSGFLPEEREWMTQWFDSGFTDAFRHLNPEKEQYSWWSYRAQARARNKGWRIDYQSVTDNLKGQLIQAYQMTDTVHSDHCPVFVEIAL